MQHKEPNKVPSQQDNIEDDMEPNMPKPHSKRCCSLYTLSSNAVVSAPSFAGCRMFLPSKNLLSHSFAQDMMYDGNWIAQYSAYTRMGITHKPSDHELVRAKQYTHKMRTAQCCKRTAPATYDGNN